LRFQGQYFDAESGLHYNRHRYYDPRLGRYLTPDPVKLAGGVNQYQYVPNPTGWVDPLGLSCNPCPGEIRADGPYSEIVPGGGLAANDSRGGHVIKKHVERTEAQLRTRLEEEPNIPIASTFQSRAEAEAALSKVIRNNQNKIDTFIKGQAKKAVINEQVSAPAGIGVIRKTGKLEQLYSIRLVLQRKEKTPLGYFILTGFVNDK
ncbi:RNase A-like domain-containing protein, partial [Pseudomonas sp. SWRI99]|uniref:RNase A-like domain-containing protein n=1 Tax=Pseudomonas sp. SWRI99 TaxID=2745506 RepID=UPI0019AE95A7